MAKRFAYVSFGILCLVAAYQLGAQRARADWDVSLSGDVVGTFGWDAVFDRAGQAWRLEPTHTPQWERAPTFDLPVPTTQIKLMSNFVIITNDDRGWVLQGSAWNDVGAYPGDPTPLAADSWAKIKGRYRD